MCSKCGHEKCGNHKDCHRSNDCERKHCPPGPTGPAYEPAISEGLVTPVTTFGGGITNIASCQYYYRAIGKLVNITGVVILTTSAAGFFTFTLPAGFPSPVVALQQGVGIGSGTAPIGPGYLSFDPTRPGVVSCNTLTTASPGTGQMPFSLSYIADI